MGGRCWHLGRCLCKATRQPTMWHDDDVVIPRRRRAVLSNVNINAIVRIMTTIVFDTADDDLRAAALSCDANDVDLHHPLHPLVDAWEYIAGLTMYGKRDGTRGVGGAGEASTRTTTKMKMFPGEGGVSRGARGGVTLGRSANNNQPCSAGGGGVSHNTGGGVSAGAPGEGEGRQHDEGARGKSWRRWWVGVGVRRNACARRRDNQP